jgi:hypothetical protein
MEREGGGQTGDGAGGLQEGNEGEMRAAHGEARQRASQGCIRALKNKSKHKKGGGGQSTRDLQ